MQLSFCMEEGPRATDGLNRCTEVTSTLDKPRRGTRARFLADLQAIPVRAPAQFAERRRGASKGLLHSGLSHPKELEGWRRTLDFPAHPSAAAAQLHSKGRMEKGTLTPSPAAWDPGVLQAMETGAADNRYGGTGTGKVCPWCSSNNLQHTLWGVGEVGTLQRAVAMRDSPLKVDSTMCM